MEGSQEQAQTNGGDVDCVRLKQHGRHARFSAASGTSASGLSFSSCCLSPSPFFVDYVPFSTEYRSFRSASSIACARKKYILVHACTPRRHGQVNGFASLLLARANESDYQL